MSTTALPEFDPADADANLDPYPLFARLREERPVYWSALLKGWVLTRYDDLKSLLGRPSAFSNSKMQPFLAHLRGERLEQVRALGEGLSRWAVFADPPYHTKLRPILNRAFLPAIPGMEPEIRTIVAELLDTIGERETFDLVAEFAVPLPTRVIMRMFGLPAEDAPRMKHWSDHLAGFVGGARLEPDKYRLTTQGMTEMVAYLTEAVAQRRRRPGSDVISRLIAASEASPDPFTEEEYVQTCTLLIFAGHETTTDLIGTGLWTLLRHPDQLAELRANPDLVEGAVEELLRFDNPVGALVRVAMEDAEIGGKTIQKGERVFVLLPSANHDPAHFPDPERLDLRRKPKGILSFGMGIHLCVGAPLARMEARIAIPAVLERFPHLELASHEFQRRDNYVVRGITSLPVRARLPA